MSFNQKFTSNKIEEILKKYPGRIPIIITSKTIKFKDNNNNKNNSNFIIPSNITMAEFIIMIRKRIELFQEESIFVFVTDKKTKKDILAPASITMDSLYSQYKDDNLILNLYFEKEAVFG
jgi:GABA(A) receptor-associated protein